MSGKDIVLLVIRGSGVGAAPASTMVSKMKPSEISTAIIQNNARLLESVKGIGRKSAEMLVLELRDKVSKMSSTSVGIQSHGNTLEQDALNALVALGISRPVGEQAIKKLIVSDPTIHTLEELIKKALKAI